VKRCFDGISQIVDGDYKAKVMQSILERKRLDKASLYAYSDSSLDLPFLRMAGRPCAVRPDRQLKRISLENGWEII
jgi:phosphoserine phosphatase